MNAAVTTGQGKATGAQAPTRRRASLGRLAVSTENASENDNNNAAAGPASPATPSAIDSRADLNPDHALRLCEDATRPRGPDPAALRAFLAVCPACLKVADAPSRAPGRCR